MSETTKYREVTAGQPMRPSAAAWNALLRLLRQEHKHDRRGNRRQTPSIGRQPGTVIIKNTATDIDRFGILGIDNVVITPTENAEGFKEAGALIGILPDEDAHLGKFVVCHEPIPFGEYGRAVVSGLTVCQVSFTKAWHPRADVKDSDTTQLLSGLTGAATILWKETGTGTKWAVVKIGNRYETVFPARIHEYTLVGTNKWEYTLIEQELIADGYGGWQDKSGGREVTAYNTVEDPNDGTGIEGNGADLEDGEVLMPAGLDAIVYCEERLFGSGETPSKSYWFQYENEVSVSSGSSTSSGAIPAYRDIRSLRRRACVNDGICQWEVFTFETWRHRARAIPALVSTSVEKGCRVPFCDESGMASGGSTSDFTNYLDQWRPCDQGSEGDIFLPIWVLDSIPTTIVNPVIQLATGGPCYYLVEDTVAGETATEVTTFEVFESCDVANCEQAECADCPDAVDAYGLQIFGWTSTTVDPSGCGTCFTASSGDEWDGTFPSDQYAEAECKWSAVADGTLKVNGKRLSYTNTHIVSTGSLHTLSIRCATQDDGGGSQVDLWTGTRSGTGPCGIYTRTSGCSAGPATLRVQEL